MVLIFGNLQLLMFEGLNSIFVVWIYNAIGIGYIRKSGLSS
jgi:hypothetical protein